MSNLARFDDFRIRLCRVLETDTGDASAVESSMIAWHAEMNGSGCDDE
jgi:hypothetical protein